MFVSDRLCLSLNPIRWQPSFDYVLQNRLILPTAPFEIGLHNSPFGRKICHFSLLGPIFTPVHSRPLGIWRLIHRLSPEEDILNTPFSRGRCRGEEYLSLLRFCDDRLVVDMMECRLPMH